MRNRLRIWNDEVADERPGLSPGADPVQRRFAADDPVAPLSPRP
jgi:hypothetical protein